MHGILNISSQFGYRENSRERGLIVFEFMRVGTGLGAGAQNSFNSASYIFFWLNGRVEYGAPFTLCIKHLKYKMALKRIQKVIFNSLTEIVFQNCKRASTCCRN